MKKSTRWITGFGIGVAALIIVTLVLIFVFERQSDLLLLANTPEGTVQRYLLAVREKDYEKAYKYLDPLGDSTGTITWTKPRGNVPVILRSPGSYEFFVDSAHNAADFTWKASIGEAAKTGGENASLLVKVQVFRNQAPFGISEHTSDVPFSLRLVEGSWLIETPLDLYWIY